MNPLSRSMVSERPWAVQVPLEVVASVTLFLESVPQKFTSRVWNGGLPASPQLILFPRAVWLLPAQQGPGPGPRGCGQGMGEMEGREGKCGVSGVVAAEVRGGGIG